MDELEFLAPWSKMLPNLDRCSCFAKIDGILTLRELATLAGDSPTVISQDGSDAAPAASALPAELKLLIAQGGQRARERIATIAALAEQCEELARQQYDFLYDPARHLLAIGYNVGERRRDASFYDLLASEARLRVSWRSPKGCCRRNTGSPWAGC